MLDVDRYAPKKKNRGIFRLLKFYWKRYLRWNRLKYQKINQIKQKNSMTENKPVQEKDDIKAILKEFTSYILKITKKFLLLAFKFILWIIPLFIGIIFYDNTNAQFQYPWVISLYVYWTCILFTTKRNYKNWQIKGEIEEFEKQFCQQYKPTGYIFISFLAVFIPMNFVPLWLYFLIFWGISLYDMFLRQYLTLVINQGLILEKLNSIKDKENF